MYSNEINARRDNLFSIVDMVPVTLTNFFRNLRKIPDFRIYYFQNQSMP